MHCRPTVAALGADAQIQSRVEPRAATVGKLQREIKCRQVLIGVHATPDVFSKKNYRIDPAIKTYYKPLHEVDVTKWKDPDTQYGSTLIIFKQNAQINSYHNYMYEIVIL